ncbi:MAG TPA: Ig-like domain-containing protein [Saprospiraceae bacterium]|nr:Ig-like domain-containing protein [Saprospiraceae bacterium]
MTSKFWLQHPYAKIGAWVMCAVIFAGCASSGSLGGGPKDVNPPKLNTELSSPNYQIRSFQKKFEFLFDEFIEIKDPIREVLVSPPLTYIPKVVGRGKKMVFEINEREELKQNTTYVINFGNSIVDLNESNPFKEFRLVFSTGDIIDSLVIEGEVKEAESGKSIQDITILVYDDLSDSILLTKKPFYTAKTDNNGKFKIENVKNDTFRIFAIKDENRSFTYNQGQEQLGFLEQLVIFEDTASMYTCALEISQPLIDYRVFESNTRQYGVIKQKWNTPIYSDLTIVPIDTLDRVYHNFEADSVRIFYTTDVDTFSVNIGFDTLRFKTPDISSKPNKLISREASRSSFLSVKDSMNVVVNYPIQKIDQSKISIIDSFQNKIAFDSKKVDDFTMRFYPKADGFKDAFLILDKGAITDIYDNVLDSTVYNYTIVPTEKLSELTLNIVELDSTRYYTMIFRDKNEKVLKKYQVEGISSFSTQLTHLRPEEYSLEIIDDTNKNGMWDPVNWWKRTQAEKVKKFKIDALKENWSLDKEIKYTSD